MESKKKEEGKKQKKKPESRLNWKKLLLNLAIMVVIFIVAIYVVSIFLNSYTEHSQSLTVPDFRGMTIPEVEKACQSKDLRYLIKDSVFSQEAPKNTITDQNPKAGQKVKRNRRIYLTLNALAAPMVKLPAATNKSRRQAIAELKNNGFNVSEDIEYKSWPDLDYVLDIKCNGVVVQPGTSLRKGSTVTLVVGDGGKSAKAELPDLVGKTFDEAVFILRESRLTLGKITTEDDEVVAKAESTNIIYKQDPTPSADTKEIAEGQTVNIWVMPRWKYKKQHPDD